MDDNIAEAYAGMGFVFCDEEEHESAIKFLKRAHQLNPYNMDYVFVLVEQHNKLGKYKTSLKYLKEIEKEPSFKDEISFDLFCKEYCKSINDNYKKEIIVQDPENKKYYIILLLGHFNLFSSKSYAHKFCFTVVGIGENG